MDPNWLIWLFIAHRQMPNFNYSNMNKLFIRFDKEKKYMSDSRIKIIETITEMAKIKH